MDRKSNRLLSLVDVDAGDVEAGVVKTPTAYSAEYAAKAPALAATAPARQMRFSDGAVALTLDNGVWSSSQGAWAAAPTPAPVCQLVCALTAIVACAPICYLLAFLGGLPGLVCTVVCGVVWAVVCWFSDC